MGTNRANELRVRIGDDARARRLLPGYHSRGIGVTNLKRMFGHPGQLRLLVTALAQMVPAAEAIAAADPGAAPLTAALALQLGAPALFVRSTPKTHRLSYGGDPDHDHPLVAGERLEEGSSVVIIDDLLHSGATMVSAATTLREVNLVVSAASCLLAAPPDGWRDRLVDAGFESVSAVALTTDL